MKNLNRVIDLLFAKIYNYIPVNIKGFLEFRSWVILVNKRMMHLYNLIAIRYAEIQYTAIVHGLLLGYWHKLTHNAVF